MCSGILGMSHHVGLLFSCKFNVYHACSKICAEVLHIRVNRMEALPPENKLFEADQIPTATLKTMCYSIVLPNFTFQKSSLRLPRKVTNLCLCGYLLMCSLFNYYLRHDYLSGMRHSVK